MTKTSISLASGVLGSAWKTASRLQNWQRILAARQLVVLAGLNYDAELKQFKEGLRTMTEVLEALTRLGEAQLREVRAVGDYQIAQIDLAFATGTLLGHSRVNWGDRLAPCRRVGLNRQ